MPGEPSSEWTKEDREKVIKKVVAAMKAEARRSTLVEPKLVFDWSETIFFVITMPASFLEDNRGLILDGLSFES